MIAGGFVSINPSNGKCSYKTIVPSVSGGFSAVAMDANAKQLYISYTSNFPRLLTYDIAAGKIIHEAEIEYAPQDLAVYYKQ